MAIELSVVFEGIAPGIAEHRLSLAVFGDPLRFLLTALQRTASGMAGAIEDPEYGSRGGKLAKGAELLDLELRDVKPGSLETSFAVVTRQDPASPQLNMLSDDTSANALKLLIEHIDAESRGIARSASARRYLQSLPLGVKHQKYVARKDGQIIASCAFGELKIAPSPAAATRLVRAVGRIVAVGFEPGTLYVHIKSDDISTQKLIASPANIDRALALRGQDVVVAVLLSADAARLMWIRPIADAPKPPPLEDTMTYLHERWGRALAELAK